MSEKTTAVLNISKALLGASFTTLGALGCAVAGMTGNFSSAALWAGLTALPGASLTLYDVVKTQITTLTSQNENNFEISAPNWWKSDTRSWQNVCTEIEDILPTILQSMSIRMRQERRVKTVNVVQQIFI